jgi:hypothetical protein
MATPQPSPTVRPVAAGGWRRAVVGLAVGAVAGGLASLALPPERPPAAGPRRGDGGR